MVVPHILPRLGCRGAVITRRIVSSSSSSSSFWEKQSYQPGIRRNFADNAAAADTKEYQFSSPKVEDLFQRMTALETAEVNSVGEIIRERLGIIIPDQVQMGSGDGAAAEEDAPPAEEKTAFDLKLMAFDKKAKIKVIKEVRAIAGLGLKEAKALVEGAPKVVKKDMKKEEAEELKKKLEDIGATIELA
mmetsp:Transcript_25405/g.35623  ORF Transcript_25405/g.35623 Transcript_25405/m.35623 type:complete len:189 (-) Transcript_25405:103-669(-)